jgi:hypothetical protein
MLHRCHIVGTTSQCHSSHAPSSTTVWLRTGFCWQPDALLKILWWVLPTLPSPCSRVRLFGLSWTIHQLTPSGTPALSPPGSSTEPSNPYRWDYTQQYATMLVAFQPLLPIESAPIVVIQLLPPQSSTFSAACGASSDDIPPGCLTVIRLSGSEPGTSSECIHVSVLPSLVMFGDEPSRPSFLTDS